MKNLALFLLVVSGCATTPPKPPEATARVFRLPQGEVAVCDTSVTCSGGWDLGGCGAYPKNLGCVPGAVDLGPYDEYEGEVTFSAPAKGPSGGRY